MKTAREMRKGNKNGLSLSLHKLFGWSIRLLLSGFCWSLYDGSLLAWFVGLQLVKELITGVIHPAWGCLFSILSFTVVVGIIIWLLIL